MHHHTPRSTIRDLPERHPRAYPLLARLTTIALALLLAALTINAIASHATPPPPASSIAIVPTTNPAIPEPNGYVPTPARQPPTNAAGQWLPATDQPSTTPQSSALGGGR